MSTKVDYLENFSTFYNMQSVSSNAVAKALTQIETYSGISGMVFYKLGRLCWATFSSTVNGTSPVVWTQNVPAKFRPILGNGGRTVYFNNSIDTPEGQFIIYQNGEVRLYKGNGGTINCSVVAQVFYFVD